MSCFRTMEAINKTWEYCLERFGESRCVVLTLHGSQNYELDLPDSDVDAKLMVVPTWEDIVFNKKPLSETIQGPYGDINVTDIRLFIGNNLKKQNFNFLECLFTIYYRVNPDYRDLWEGLIEQREQIAHYKPEEAIRTMMGQIENQWRRWNSYGGKEKDTPLDNKKTLYHMARIYSAIKRYQEGLPFVDTLIAENHDWIMDVRLGKVDEETMEKKFKDFYSLAYAYAESEYKGAQYEAEAFLDDMQMMFIYRAMKKGWIKY